MKAEKSHLEKWEEENLIHLLNFSELFFEKFLSAYKSLYRFVSIALFIIYKLSKTLLLILKVVFLSEPTIAKIERDDSWIFRQLK